MTAEKPWPQASARTIFLRVPTGDWAAVKRGIKTEFRSKGRAAEQLWRVQCPTPVLAWKGGKNTGRQDRRLMVLEATWIEALREISPESLAREGFSSIAEFRRYWTLRHHSAFPPLMNVRAYRLRPFTEDDRLPMGQALLERLYGGHLDTVR